MLYYNLLLTVRERDGESGGENEVHSLQSALQEATMLQKESGDVEMIDQAPIEGQIQGQPVDDASDLQITSVRTLRSARKRQMNTVKNRESQIKDHEAKADGVEGDLANAEPYLQSHQSELEDAQNKLAAAKEDLKKTKAQLTGKRKDLTACNRKLQESKGFGRRMKEVNSDLRNSLTASQEELSKCKDDLFSLQGVAQTPDSIISKRFESVSQQIVHWIDAEAAAVEKEHPEAEPGHVFSVGEDKRANKFLRDHPGAEEHLARYLIHRFLQYNVFEKKVQFFGLPEETAQLLLKAELKMAEFDPPRDSVAIASWRSETLKALAMTTECGEFCQQQSQNLNTRLFKELSKALPTLFSGRQTHATFYDQVLLPAVKLANTIRMSTSDYVFSIPGSPDTKSKPVSTDLLGVHKMIDSKSGRQLKPDSAVIADKDGVIGYLIICLEPGLHRVIKGKETILRQAMFLVELSHPLGKRSKFSA